MLTRTKSTISRFTKDRRNHRDYPDRMHLDNLGAYEGRKRSFEEQLDVQINQAQEERPTVLRSNVVDKHLINVLNRTRNPNVYQGKLAVVRKLIEFKMDTRVLNNMRQVMNEKIEDARGLMSVAEFKKMFFTSFR